MWRFALSMLLVLKSQLERDCVFDKIFVAMQLPLTAVHTTHYPFLGRYQGTSLTWNDRSQVTTRPLAPPVRLLDFCCWPRCWRSLAAELSAKKNGSGCWANRWVCKGDVSKRQSLDRLKPEVIRNHMKAKFVIRPGHTLSILEHFNNVVQMQSNFWIYTELVLFGTAFALWVLDPSCHVVPSQVSVRELWRPKH